MRQMLWGKIQNDNKIENTVYGEEEWFVCGSYFRECQPLFDRAGET